MSQLPPELFSHRPIRSEFGRERVYRKRRIVTILVCVLLLAGILYRALSWTPSASGEVPVIKAENSAWKQRPEQPGGIDIPHQDVQVYQELDGKDSDTKQVEHLLPPPESPQSAVTPTVSAAPPPLTDQTETLTPSKPEPVAEAPVPAPSPVATTVDPAPTPAPAPVAAAPEPAKTVAAPAPRPKKKATAVAQPAKEPAVRGSGHAVQLASVQDEKSAHAMMEQLQARYASTLGDAQLHLVRADLGSKGVYYRIRSEALPGNQANRICATLVKAKAGCILVH